MRTKEERGCLPARPQGLKSGGAWHTFADGPSDSALAQRGLCMWRQSIFSLPAVSVSAGLVSQFSLGAVSSVLLWIRPSGSGSCRQSGCPVAMPPPREVGHRPHEGEQGLASASMSQPHSGGSASINAALSAVGRPTWELSGTFQNPGWRSVYWERQGRVKVPKKASEGRFTEPVFPGRTPLGTLAQSPCHNLGGNLRAGLPVDRAHATLALAQPRWW